jgi:hypothetical protein
MENVMRKASLILFALPLLSTLGCGDDGGSPADDAADETSTGTSDPTSESATSPSSTGTSTSPGDGDGDGDGDDGSTSSASDTDDGSDDTTGGISVPEVLDVSPADGATGVSSDATIVITFSEPMDPTKTQAAYQSADLPGGSVTFSWNDDRDQLTITPNTPLDYAAASSTADPAQVYSYTLTKVAEAETGESLADDLTVSFSTLRQFDQTFGVDLSLSSNISALGNKTASSYLGDYPDNDWNRYFMTFDMSELAADIETVDTATLTVARTNSVSGTPFTDLGGVAYQQVSYTTLAPATFGTPGIGPDALIFGGLAPSTNTVNVKSQFSTFLSDPDTHGDRFQFRLFWFPSSSDSNNDYDGIVINPNSLAVTLSYLAP